MRYIKMDIEMDSLGNYDKAIIHFWHNGQIMVDKKTGYDVRMNLKQFAEQENVTVRELLHDQNKVKVNVPYYTPETPIPSYVREKYSQPKVEREPIHITMPRIPKGVIKLAALGTVAVFLLNPLINYQVQKDNALNNQYVSFEYNSPSEKMSRELINVLGTYEDFDLIMQNLANENWSELKGVDLNSFFSELDTILTCNMPGIEKRYETHKLSKEAAYKISLAEYFKNSPVDYAAINWFDLEYSFLVESSYRTLYGSQSDQLDYTIKSFLKYVIDRDYKIGRDANGNDTYYMLNNMSPLAQYILVARMRPVIAMMDDVKYGYYSKEQILEKIDSTIEWSLRNINYEIANSKTK